MIQAQLLVVAIALAAASGKCLAAEAQSEWVYPGPDGKLVYKETERGDHIMDFSHAGYMGGGVALPEVVVKRTVQPPGSGDATETIQQAIDEVARLPLEGGFRGAVLLEPGIYECSGPIRISASGVVLRGSEGTIIRMTGRPHTAMVIGRERRRGGNEPAVLAETSITNGYVPSGSLSFNVASAQSFRAGDTILIRRPVTEAWVKFMEMHDLVRDGRPQTWLRTGTTIDMERRIARVEGRKIALDVPLSDSFDAAYLNPPGTVVAKITPPERITQAGIERLSIECPPQAISHTERHFTAIRVNGEDCWVRDVICKETMNSVAVSGRRITLSKVVVKRTARHVGSSRPAEFAPNGTQVLMDRCAVEADNVWFVATGARVSGPIVLLNCDFTGQGRAESHQRWSTAMLYDNCKAPEGGFEFRNRGSMGSGHGWSMGWGVAWNCEAKDYVIQNPPGAMNWLIGSKGESTNKPRPFGSAPMLGEGTMDSHGTPVEPRSLYLAQLQERLGAQALANIGYGPETAKSLSWRKQSLFFAPFENCTTADLNKDGHVDIVYGPYWLAGPGFVPRAYRANFVRNEYHRNNSDHVMDVDGDGWLDIIAGYWDTNGLWWYRNPGNKPWETRKGWEIHKPWEGRQLAPTRGRMEIFVLHDYDRDGTPEIHSACYAKKEPLEVFRFKRSTGRIALDPFVLGREGGGHGVAFGDVNGDGREDVLCEIGWYERPKGDPFAQPWKHHPETDLSRMHPSCPFVVKDLNRDGRLDIIFGRGHDYGLFWWEQLTPKPDGTTQWKQHSIDKTWSQAHAISFADLDADGEEELIAGKCIWAHDAGDPGAGEPPAIYYYKWDKLGLKFTRHTIAAPGEGIALGRQYSITDLNKDGRPDLLAPSKHSFWVLYNEGYK